MVSGITGKRKWMFTLLGLAIAIVLLDLGVRKVFRGSSSRSTTAVAETQMATQTTPASAPSVPAIRKDPSGGGTSDESTNSAVPSTDASVSSPPSIPDGTNCYNNKAFRESPIEKDVNSQTRNDFATKASESLSRDNVDVYADTAGQDNQYLLFVAPPESLSALEGLGALIKTTPKYRFNLCFDGFAEVQFIVRDSDLNQTLLMKLPTNLKESENFGLQHLARPM